MTSSLAPRIRPRDLGIRIGRLPPGVWDAITDVPGVRVRHATVVAGEGPLVVGRGPVRTGVTVVLPREEHVGLEPVFAAPHVFNGAGAMTGVAWVEESRLLTTPVAITASRSCGTRPSPTTSRGARPSRRGGACRWSRRRTTGA